MPGGAKRYGPEFDFKKFEGFAAPGSTPVPDVFFDKIMAHLSDVELRVLLYFFRRTFGFKKFSDNISISQMVNGIETRERKVLDYGSGLSKSGVTKGLRGLLKKNLIVATRRSDPKRGNLPTNYALNMKGRMHDHESDVDTDRDEMNDSERTPPLSTSGDKGVSPSEHKGSAQRGQGLSTSGDTQDTVTKKQKNKVVNDLGNPLRDRVSNQRKNVISDDALRSTYRLSDDGIERVHWLVDKQAEVLGSVDRNHAHYVKRAAEAVRDGRTNLLDQMLGELKQFSRTIPLASHPAYFHRMYQKALKASLSESADQRQDDAPGANHNPDAERHGRGLFRPPDEDDETDPRARLIEDAEQRGFPVPDHIRQADLSTMNEWWASLGDGSPTA